jgi:hypothetical protein
VGQTALARQGSRGLPRLPQLERKACLIQTERCVPRPLLDARARLCSTYFNFMQNYRANTNLAPVPCIAPSIPAMRISGSNLRAGNEA